MTKSPTQEDIKRFKKAQAELENGDPAVALQYFEEVSETMGEHADIWYFIGQAHGKLNQIEKAKHASNQALRMNPDHIGALVNLGNAEFASGNIQSALTNYQRAIEIAPDNPILIQSYGQALNADRQHNKAIRLFESALDKFPDNSQFHASLGMSYAEAGKIHQALSAFERSLVLDPKFIHAHLGVCYIYQLTGDYKRAERHYREILDIDPKAVVAYIGLAEICRLSGYYTQALDYIRQSEQQSPTTPALMSKKLEILEYAGNFEEAYKLIQQLKTAGFLNATSLMSYANICHKINACDDAHALIDQYLASPISSLSDKQILNFAAGRMLDRLGRYDEAFSYFHNGNEDQKRAFNVSKSTSFEDVMNTEFTAFNGRQESDFTDIMIKSFSSSNLKHLQRSSVTSSRPIFIVGMPRSGTSLTEQILSAHPDVYGAGELGDIGNIFSTIWNTASSEKSDLIKKLHELGESGLTRYANEYLEILARKNKKAYFVTDKMPHNFHSIGLISLLFPKSRIIRCSRNPMDNALSIYFQQFSSYHKYATDIEDIGIYYRAYERLMKHWESVIDIPLHTVQYEDLVQNQELVSKALLDFCGLDWDDAVLNFHDTKRPVSTASYDQVRQPVYQSSRERWKNYEKHLGNLKEILSFDD